MSTVTVTNPPQETPRRRVRTLPRRVRQAVLIVHIVSAGAWIGIDVIVAVLVVTGRFAGSVETRVLAQESLATFVLWPMLAAGVACLVSGIVLGIGTKWGLLRYRWVAVKLVINVVLCVAIVAALRPSLATVSADPGTMPDGLFFPPAVSLVALSLATTIAVMKPWGRLRRRRTEAVSAAP